VTKNFDNLFVESPRKAFDLVTALLTDTEKEQLFVIFLDSQKRCLSCEVVSTGTVCETEVDPRNVFRLAVLEDAAFIIMAHNHPSLDIEPSDEDISLTKRIIGAGKILGIPLLDHIIVSTSDYLSLRAYCSVKQLSLFERG